MEIALNLVWLGVSLALLVGLGSHLAGAGYGRSRSMAVVALVCLVCFLFPVISMTDDLNSGKPALLEPSKLKKLLLASPVLLTLPPWPTLRKPQENRWSRPGLRQEKRPFVQQVVAFGTSRRPPPPRTSVL